MNETTIKCPSCGSTDITRVERTKNHHLCLECFQVFVPGNPVREAQKQVTQKDAPGHVYLSWQSKTQNALCELRLEGTTKQPVSVVFTNKRGQEVYWPYSDWKRLANQIATSVKRLKKQQAET